MIYVTGDTHGARDFFKLLSPELSKLTKNDYVIICGDAGVIFNKKEAPYFINLYSYLPFTVLFVDGNHENFDALNSYPEEIWCGGKVHRLSNSVFHLKRGQVYTIENKSFFTFGGALSFDKARRKEGESWWKQEMPTKSDYKEAMANLHGLDAVDYIISHDCPTFLMQEVAKHSQKLQDEGIVISKSNMYLEKISRQIAFNHWYFAHYHIDQAFGENYDCVFNRIIQLR